MIIKYLTRQAIKISKYPIALIQPSQHFVLFKMFKKRFQQRQQRFKSKPEKYSAQDPEAKKQQKQKQDENQSPEAEYDFFSRQREIQLNQDYRKIRQQSQHIPQDVGKGGFNQVVYWSQFAKSPQQIIDLVKVFNRIQLPPQVEDKLRFNQFGDKAMKTVYLSTNLNTLQQFATFGQKYSILQQSYWQKIQQKTRRLNPKTKQQIRDCIQIAFLMSKMRQGSVIYSSLANLFKNFQLTPEDTAKLLLIYSNTQSGDKSWVQKLMKNLIQSIQQVKKQIIIELLSVFKKAKNIPDTNQKRIFNQLQKLLPSYNFKQICLVGAYIGHGKMSQNFWSQLQKRVIQKYPKKPNLYSVLYLTDLLSSYSLSTQFVQKYYIPILREDNYKYLNVLEPQFLSAISKTLYIYELQGETKDIEQIIQTRIIKIFNDLKNVQIQNLIKVIKDYTVTRVGSRELYIFLQQVADALFQQIKASRQHLETLQALYSNSQLCSPGFLEKIQTNL